MEWVVAIVVAVFGSSGLWAYLASRQKKAAANGLFSGSGLRLQDAPQGPCA